MRHGKTLEFVQLTDAFSPGTFISVAELFGKFPVKHKIAISNAASSTAKIKKMLERIFLVFPKVHISLSEASSLVPAVSSVWKPEPVLSSLLVAPACKNVQARFGQLFSKPFAQDLHDFSYTHINSEARVGSNVTGSSPVTVEGLMCNVERRFTSRELQFIYVNNRKVVNRAIQSCVDNFVGKCAQFVGGPGGDNVFIVNTNRCNLTFYDKFRSGNHHLSAKERDRGKRRYAIFVLQIFCSPLLYDIFFDPAKVLRI